MQHPSRKWMTAMTLAPALAVALACGITSAGAQTSALPQSGGTTDMIYRLGADDAVSIKVVNFPELSTDASVSTDGKIAVSLIGSVPVAGRTTAEAAALLTRLWSKYVIAPAVSVAVTHKHSQIVLFYGGAAKAGPVDVPPGTHVLEALAIVGGAAINGDLSHVTVTHRDGQKRSLDLSHPETKGGSADDVLLSPNDVVYIPQQQQEIGVLGQVDKPGDLPFHDGMTVLDALTAAGGLKDTADMESSELIRGGAASKINLRSLLREANLSLNEKLMAGDILSIPERHAEFDVLGEVVKPGSFAYKDDTSVLDAITAAGGVKDTADLDRATLVHDGTENKLDLKSLLQAHNLSANQTLSPGDSISVPPKLQGQVGVLGAVKAPGSYPYHENITILEALTAAGGVNEDIADLGAATLDHEGKNTPLQLTALLHSGDLTHNVQLAPGDRVLIPVITARNYVFGAVQHPGYYPLKTGDRVIDVLNAVGGPAQNADLGSVNVIRIDHATNTAAVQRVNLSRFLTKGDMQGNVPLQPGDVVFVPDKKHSFGFGDILGALTGLSTVRLLTGAGGL